MSTRRTWLGGCGAVALTALAPRLTLAGNAAAGAGRFVFVIQRGAADGLDTVVPYADPGYARLRGALAIDAGAAHRLDGSFALHPALIECARLYAAGQLLPVHAVATAYRERSHFDGQDVLEGGGTRAHERADGWLNRLLGLLPEAGAGRRGGAPAAVALAPTIPLALRGANEVASYAPSSLPQASDDLLLRIAELYRDDAQLQPLWDSALGARAMAGAAHGRGEPMRGDQARGPQDAATLGRLAATFLDAPQGARIAMIETGGWDTHSAQAPRLSAQLRALDTLLAALRDGLGARWRDTTVLVATEFGRSAAANGTGGTDHGTGAAALLAGGAVAGGRVAGDWPGIARAQLNDGRDLRATTDMRALFKGVLRDHLGIPAAALAGMVFPGSVAVDPMAGLVRTA